MTDHDEPVDDELDQRLGEAVREMTAMAPKTAGQGFISAARVRRDRARRHRRVWTIAMPVAAAILLVVVIGIASSGGHDSTTTTQLGTTGGDGDQASISCPKSPGQPNTTSGTRLFQFSPSALTLCTYQTDGRLVATNSVPGNGSGTVAETLSYVERSYVNQAPPSSVPDCAADGSVPVDRVGVIATDGAHHATAWIPISGCTTLPGNEGDALSNDATPTFHGKSGDVRFSGSGAGLDVQMRPAGAAEYGPRQIVGPKSADAWTAMPFGLPEATIHVVVLPAGSQIINMSDVADVTVGTGPCGGFRCAVFEVPRDRPGRPPTLKITSDGQISSIPLKSVPVGQSALHFNVNS